MCRRNIPKISFGVIADAAGRATGLWPSGPGILPKGI